MAFSRGNIDEPLDSKNKLLSGSGTGGANCVISTHLLVPVFLKVVTFCYTIIKANALKCEATI